jgi:hypothetical protein
VPDPPPRSAKASSFCRAPERQFRFPKKDAPVLAATAHRSSLSPDVIATHTYRGYWWLPEDEKTKLSGTLTITKGDAKLELLDNFGRRLISKAEKGEVYSFSLAEQPRILGVSTDGKPITLEGHLVASTNEHFPGIPTSTYSRSVAFIGAHFEADEEIGFDEIAIKASDLNTWTCVSGFSIKTGMREHEQGYLIFEKVDISYEAPDDIEIPLAGGERAFIRFTAPSEGIGSGADHIALRQEAALHLRFARRASLDQVFERVGHIRNFLSLAVGRPVAIFSVTGFQDDFVREKSEIPIPITLLWEIPHNPEPPARKRDAREMLFTLPDAQPGISRVMRAWFAKQERLKPVFNLFFGSRYHPDLYLDVRFLLHAQAIETYDYRRRRKPGNKHLVQRIADVLDECTTVAKRIVGRTAAERADFVEAVKVARNYYTHYNPKLEKKVARGAALLLLLVQLQAIIEMSLLRELGFPARAINAILDRVDRYREIEHFKELVAEESAEAQ